ncbi:MAG: DUF1844 domain-containing protein [Candidatus Zhuqueibacterota bacterium]
MDRLSQEEKNKFLFSYVVMSHQTSALVNLGLVKDPTTQKTEVNLDNARLAIDVLEMLADKTKNNLSKDEHDFLQSTLQQIRLAFIKVAEKADSADRPK